MTTAANLTAGDELDRLIAERVMGWFGHRETGSEGRRLWVDHAQTDADPAAQNYYRGRVMAAEHEWRPSTNIADAWQVVEWLRRHPPAREPGYSDPWLAIEAPSPEATQWTAAFHQTDGYVQGAQIEASAATGPLAICLLAMKVAGAVVDA